MQVVKNILIMLIIGWLALLLFMPKQELYYKLESELETQEVKINEGSIEEGLFSLTIREADVYAKGIKLATANKIDIFSLLFYTKIEVDFLEIDASLKTMAPTTIDSIVATHAVWNPLGIDIETEGPFGSAVGTMDVVDNYIRLDFNASQANAPFKDKLNEDEEGWYYETSL
ncbi:MAG: Unknown protein [uncultured Sulfurovum sp.]|uniref:DUF3971 domain-containing protein n=1 Tax=uncultured Sulfurovum sp. TaxID=269237 RepID=A0A6S6UG41_9BACT|nr:MAG: Unknown protein [uncultured Sulfurovum sp.]